MSSKERGVLETPPEEELALMCEKGNADRVQQLLDHGVNVNTYSEERSYLFIAARNGHSAIVGKLIRAGAELQRTHLTAAIRGGNKYCAEKILDEFFYAGTEVDLPHLGHELMLERGAAKSTTPGMLRWLADNGVEFGDVDRLGRTVLDVAQLDRAPQEILDTLEELST